MNRNGPAPGGRTLQGPTPHAAGPRAVHHQVSSNFGRTLQGFAAHCRAGRRRRGFGTALRPGSIDLRRCRLGCAARAGDG